MLDVNSQSESISETEMTNRLEAAKKQLSEERQKKIASLRFEKDQKLSLGAGMLLDLGLREYGVRERDVLMAKGPVGKPYLPEHPEIHFNLSHSGNVAMAVFSDREAGCDVEQIKKSVKRVADRFFCEPERQFLAEADSEEEESRRFFQIWTLKESYLKVTGEGTHFPLDRFCIYRNPLRIQVDGRPAACSLYEYELPGYRAAVCLEGEKPERNQDVFFSFQNLWDVV